MKKKIRFKYFGFGLWRGVDSLGRTSKFYSWDGLWKRYDKKLKEVKDATI
jgi:uncharacterized membrane protein